MGTGLRDEAAQNPHRVEPLGTCTRIDRSRRGCPVFDQFTRQNFARPAERNEVAIEVGQMADEHVVIVPQRLAEADEIFERASQATSEDRDLHRLTPSGQGRATCRSWPKSTLA